VTDNRSANIREQEHIYRTKHQGTVPSVSYINYW